MTSFWKDRQHVWGNVYSIRVMIELKTGNIIAVFIGNYRGRRYEPNMPLVQLIETENQQSSQKNHAIYSIKKLCHGFYIWSDVLTPHILICIWLIPDFILIVIFKILLNTVAPPLNPYSNIKYLNRKFSRVCL